MIPIRDDNPRLFPPYVTLTLVAANVIVWVLFQGMGTDPALAASVCELGLIPGELLGGASDQVAPLSRETGCVLTDPAYHTLLTSMFSHGSWLHLIGNLWFLWIFGDNVEDSMGHARFAVFYVLCGLAASALQIAFSPDSVIPMVGASGAIGGVMGAYVVLYPRVRVHLLVFLGFLLTTVAVPAILMLGYWFFIQLASAGLSVGRTGGGVAFWAHVGGFAAGAIAIFFFRNAELVAKHPHRGWSKR